MSEDKKNIKIEDAETEAEAKAADAAEEKAEEAKAEDQAAEEPKDEAAEEKAEDAEAKEDAASEEGGEEPEKTEDAAKKAEEEAAQESERYMRLMAEFQNYKRRAAKEKTDTLQYANEKIVADILPVLDNFERALTTETEDIEGYAKGMQLIFEQLYKALENAGLEEIKALDEDFDPNVHNAVMTDNIEDKDDGKITKVLQKGYKLRDKVVRPSMVAVNKK
jgi:molecular chaperone GrpE